MELLLLSNSTAYGPTYLDHAMDPISEILNGTKEVLFVPFALADHDGYTAQAAEALSPSGVTVTGAHVGDSIDLTREADAIFVGGGNSFRLLKELHTRGLARIIRDRVRGGVPYIGSSAGTNMACPTLRTTNDMPIVEPPTFDALGLVPFRMNPHYVERSPDSTHMGETRSKRLMEFLEENDVPVVALREGTWLRQSSDRLKLDGSSAGGVLFRRGSAPEPVRRNTDLSELLASIFRDGPSVHLAGRFGLLRMYRAG
ncbi:alpha-aspartyl dipeptidase [Streptomyces sp. 3212.3]|uniref:dipeptidase PepE n=2 Tax=unclassified Streptomyces TaxID=2593676 RepID=UPI000E255373|nr:dipeptidase PepE [Streptomyces sp. 3212.3]REE58607.1 alpha-aspartyl dipeptidase [Streptomyces sp. 3212.3]